MSLKRISWMVGLVILVLMGGFYGYRRFHPSVTADRAAISYRGETSKTALDLLRSKATIETVVDPNLGEFVTSINHVKGGANGKYWIYLVNDQPSAISPDRYETKSNETISWKLE